MAEGRPAGSASRAYGVREGVFELDELSHHGVELTVGDGRRIEHVIAPPRVVQPLAEVRVSLARRRQGRRKLDFSFAGRRGQDLFRHVGTLTPAGDVGLQLASGSVNRTPK